MSSRGPKYLKEIESTVSAKLKCIKNTNSEVFEKQQKYYDDILEVPTYTYNNKLLAIFFCKYIL